MEIVFFRSHILFFQLQFCCCCCVCVFIVVFCLFFSRVETNSLWLWATKTYQPYLDLLHQVAAVPLFVTSLSTWTAPLQHPPQPPLPLSKVGEGGPPCHPHVQHQTPIITNNKLPTKTTLRKTTLLKKQQSTKTTMTQQICLLPIFHLVLMVRYKSLLWICKWKLIWIKL